MKQLTIAHIKEKAVPILKEAGITRSSLFGSYARGEESQDSDVDILVDFPENKSLFEFAHVKVQLEETLGKKVDLVPYDKIKPLLKDSILANQIVLL